MTSIGELARNTFELFRPPRKQTVSEWADEKRVLVSESSAEPGRWRTDRAPYQREIMDAFTQPGIWQIVIMASAQVGKSEIELNMMGAAIDNDPGPMLYVQPTDSVAEDYSKRRIAPMIAACPSLNAKVYKAKSRDASNTIGLKTFPGGSLAIIGANSPSELRSKPVRYLFMDETDAFPASAGTEGDPQELAEKRTETYRHNRKVVKTSTPALKNSSKIEHDYLHGTQEEWHTECPCCHEYSFIRFPDIHYEKEKFVSETGEEDYKVLSVEWVCPKCGKGIPEHTVKRLPAKWVALNPKAADNGIRSFRLNAFMSPWSDWKEICLKWLKAQGDEEKLKTFTNLILGESWEVTDNKGLDDKLYKRREHYEAEVPDGVLVLTCGIDTQDNRLEYEVVGWDRKGQSWGIQRGVIPGRADAAGTWEEVDQLLDSRFERRNGMKMKILATFMDSGGHHTSAVYRECAKRNSKKLFAIKGEPGEGKEEVRQMKRGSSQDLRFMVGVDAGKEGIMFEANLDEPGPGYMHFPLDARAGYNAEFFRGLISERMEIHRVKGKAVTSWTVTYSRNEPLDCRNYARTAYRFFNWQFDRMEAILSGNEEKKITTREQAEKKKMPKARMVSRGINV